LIERWLEGFCVVIDQFGVVLLSIFFFFPPYLCRCQEKKPSIDDPAAEEAVLKISLAQPGSEPITVRAKSSTLVSK
jgi:hypothetical protein